MKLCPCGSEKRYLECCGVFLLKKSFPATPEALMRSRYTAFVEKNADYLKKTMKPPALLSFNKKTIFVGNPEWLGLKIIETGIHAERPDIQYVEFIAKYRLDKSLGEIHERSEFHFIDNRWYYVDGTSLQR